MENIVRKGEIACNKQFLLFPQCFLLYIALIFHFKCNQKCRLQFTLISTSLKFCGLVLNNANYQAHIHQAFSRPIFVFFLQDLQIGM